MPFFIFYILIFIFLYQGDMENRMFPYTMLYFLISVFKQGGLVHRMIYYIAYGVHFQFGHMKRDCNSRSSITLTTLRVPGKKKVHLYRLCLFLSKHPPFLMIVSVTFSFAPATFQSTLATFPYVLATFPSAIAIVTFA
jgi:hypothetical protein